MSIEKRYDFRGGYAANTPPEQMEENELLTGTNIYYHGNLIKRPSWENYCVSDEISYAGAAVVGIASAYMNSTWYTIIAIDGGDADGVVKFYFVANATTTTEIKTAAAATYSWTTALDVEMVEYNNMIVAVNGTDAPAIIRYNGSAVVAQDLQAYDSRARGNDDWYAGQWDDSGATPDLQFIDDTDAAQDTTENDFAVATATNNDGFYVAGTLPFTKVIMTGVTDLGTSVTAEYTYYAGSGTWTSVGSLVTTPDWVAAEGNKTIEFNIPLDSTTGALAWEKYGDVSSDADPTGVPGGAINRYIFRVRFTTADTAGTCDQLTVSHEQYLNQLFQGDIPSTIAAHKDRVYLGSGSAFTKSPGELTGLKGWAAADFEYADEGGKDIIAMHSGESFLAIIKEFGWYRYYGTTTANFNLRFGGEEGGISTRGISSIKSGVIFLSTDGIYFMPPQGELALISKSISSDFTPVQGDIIINYGGNILVSDPSADTMFWADPDTLRVDDMGDGRVSWWKWTGQNAECLLYDKGLASATLLLAYDSDNTRIVKAGANAYDTDKSAATTNITCTFAPKYESYGTPNTKKRYVRFKPDLSKSGDWTLTMKADNGITTDASTISSSTGSGHYYGDISIPWELDGYNITFQLVNTTANAVQIYGYSVEVERRAF